MRGLSHAQRAAILAAQTTRTSVAVELPVIDLRDMMRRGLVEPLGTVGANGLDNMRILPLALYVKSLDDMARGVR